MTKKNESKGIHSEYTEMFNDIRKEVHNDEVALGILQVIMKDRRGEKATSRSRGAIYPDSRGDKITPAQLWKLKQLNVSVPDDCTKLEASQLIEQNLNAIPV